MAWGVLPPGLEHCLTADKGPGPHPEPGATPGDRRGGLRNVVAGARCIGRGQGIKRGHGEKATSVYDTGDISVFLGLDVGKGEHHAHGLTPAGKTVYDKRLPNTEPKLRALFDKLITKFGTVLVIVDQPANIGALPLTVARDAGCQVAYLPGLAMRRAAEMYEGEAKTDARDAAVIAEVARTAPRTLRVLTVVDETEAELALLVGFDQDLAGESTRTSNRLRGLLTQIRPSLERVLGPHRPSGRPGAARPVRLARRDQAGRDPAHRQSTQTARSAHGRAPGRRDRRGPGRTDGRGARHPRSRRRHPLPCSPAH
jgi:hypothetical protein